MRVIYQLDIKTTTIAHLLNNNSISDIAKPPLHTPPSSLHTIASYSLSLPTWAQSEGIENIRPHLSYTTIYPTYTLHISIVFVSVTHLLFTNCNSQSKDTLHPSTYPRSLQFSVLICIVFLCRWLLCLLGPWFNLYEWVTALGASSYSIWITEISYVMQFVVPVFTTSLGKLLSLSLYYNKESVPPSAKFSVNT